METFFLASAASCDRAGQVNAGEKRRDLVDVTVLPMMSLNILRPSVTDVQYGCSTGLRVVVWRPSVWAGKERLKSTRGQG